MSISKFPISKSSVPPSSGVQSVSGDGVTIIVDNSDPQNPIISAINSSGDTIYTADGVVGGSRVVSAEDGDSISFRSYDTNSASFTSYGYRTQDSQSASFGVISGSGANVNGISYDLTDGFLISDDEFETGLVYDEDYSSEGSQLDLWVPHLEYIRANFVLLSQSADMFKSVYDTNDDGIVDKAQSVIFKAQLAQAAQRGNLVYGQGRNQTTLNPIVGLADNTVSFADKPVGMVLSNGSAGDVVEVVKIGVIENIDTSSYAVGETLYLSTFGQFNQRSNINTGVFSPIGFVAASAFTEGSIIIDTTANESINTDNTINNSNVAGRTVTEALNNKISKPDPASSFELDILRRSNTSGEFEYFTPVGGSVKINGMLQGVTVVGDGNVDIDFTGNTQSFSSSVNQFPRNIANQFPNQDPVSNPNTFYPEIFLVSTGRWIENPIAGQIHTWRITATFTRTTTAGNRQMRFVLGNPDTGFELSYSQEIRRITGQQSITANITTVADAGSIGLGYSLNIDLDNQQATQGSTNFISVDVSRFSWEKI